MPVRAGSGVPVRAWSGAEMDGSLTGMWECSDVFRNYEILIGNVHCEN